MEIAISPDRLPSGTPPVLVVENGIPLVYIDGDGALIVADGLAQSRLAVGALPAARILMDEEQRLLLLSGPTDSYPHGVLGQTGRQRWLMS